MDPCLHERVLGFFSAPACRCNETAMGIFYSFLLINLTGYTANASKLQTACKCRKSQQKKYNYNLLAGVKTVNVNFVLFSNFAPHLIFIFFFLIQIFNNAHFWQFILAFIADNWDDKKQAAGQTDMMFRKGSWNETENVVKHIHQAYWPMCPGSGECGRGRVGEVLVRMRLFRLLVLQLQT